MKIALDVMGGDNAPYSNIIGAKLFIEAIPNSDTKIIFVGPETIIKEEIKKNGLNEFQDKFEIYHADDIITMDEIKPTYAFKNKPNSSLVKAVQLVKENKANAIISAGNTAALLSSSLFLLVSEAFISSSMNHRESTSSSRSSITGSSSLQRLSVTLYAIDHLADSDARFI